MKVQESLELFIRKTCTPKGCLEMDIQAEAEFRAAIAPLLELLETYKEGLHQAKFEYQCLRADLGHEQKKCDRLQTDNEALRAKLFTLTKPV